MGTVWFFASSAQTSEELALRAIIGGAICITAILFLYTLVRKKLNVPFIFFVSILVCSIIVSLILLAEAISSITTSGVVL